MNVKPGEVRSGFFGDRAAARRPSAPQATREALIDAARTLFTERGYDDVGTEEIVRAAGVTRGALYHHFGGKREPARGRLRTDRGGVDRARRPGRLAARSCDSPLEAMRAGIEAFLDECAKPELRQIALHDAPAVLGWERWREIGAANGLGLIEASLRRRSRRARSATLPVKPLAHLLMGALDEAAMLVARAEDPAEPGRGDRGPDALRLLLAELLAVDRVSIALVPACATPSARTSARRPAASPRPGVRLLAGSRPCPRRR